MAEAQLKLVASPRHLPALRQALESADQNPGGSSLVTRTYYDSPDRTLQQRRLTFYVQEQDGCHVQTLEALGAAAGSELAVEEWQDPVAAGGPDLTAPKTGSHLPAVQGIRQMFKTQMRRTLFEIHPDPSVEIAAMLEEGEIHASEPDATEPVCQLELELKRGDPTFLYDMALGLLDLSPLRMETESQSERGYRLSGGKFEAVTARPVALEPSMTVEDVLQNVGREGLAHLLRNEPAAVAGDAEAVHQMRVALRRLRSALSAVRSMLPADQYKWLKDELKWLTSRLGPARDWDVFVADLLPPVRSGLPEVESLERLADAAMQRRNAAHNVAREAIESRRYAESILRLARWFETRDWRDQRVSEHSAPLFSSIASLASSLLERRWRHARKQSWHFGDLSQTQRHEARIALKNLRYMTEFLGGLFDADGVEAMMKPLKWLQDELGHFADVRTAQRLIAEIAAHAGDDTSELVQYAGMVVGWHIHGLTHAEARLRRDMRRFRRAKPFWR